MRSLALLSFGLATCNTTTGGAPAPTTTAPTPPAPTATATAPAPVPSVQNPDDCSTACAQAQSACTNPLPIEHCIAVCEAAAKNLAAPGIACIAKVATCNQECQP